MAQQWKEIQVLHDQFHRRFGKRILEKNHKGRRVDKAFFATNFLHRNWIYIGELCLALVLSFSTLIFGSGNGTPNNLELVYPLQEVSTLECRTQERNTLSPECQKTLPIIHGANYAHYENNTDYTDIYTVLYGGSYTSGWRTDLGSHYGVDIASSKGTPLYSIADGKVYFAGEQAGYGNVVKIEFVYQGIRYFAIYGHMDTISVKVGETVSRGQKVGTVGNSGLTMGALGGYHVHFEVAKGDTGRPVYAFYNCPDLAKGGVQIINQGLCRTEMFNTTVDPIALLETAKAKLPHPGVGESESEHYSALDADIEEKAREQLIKIAKLYLDSPYQFGGTGTLPGNPMDCSKLTQNVFAQVGIVLDRSSSDQAHQFSYGGYWYDALEKAEIGDLIFFKNTEERSTTITHVGIFVGNGMMLHAGAEKVELTPLNGYWNQHFKGVGSFKYFIPQFNKEKAKNAFDKLNALTITKGRFPDPKSVPSVSSASNELSSVSLDAPKESLVLLDDKKLDAVGKAFFAEWDISLKGDTTSQLQKGEKRTLTLEVIKANGDKFNGILKQPIILVPNSTHITIEPIAISLVKDGKVDITLTANQAGIVYTAINMGTNRMGGMSIEII